MKHGVIFGNLHSKLLLYLPYLRSLVFPTHQEQHLRANRNSSIYPIARSTNYTETALAMTWANLGKTQLMLSHVDKSIGPSDLPR